MSLTLKPILRCNLDCVDCYERTTLNPKNPRPDVEAIIATMARERPGERVILHGGEIMLLRMDEAERLCAAAKAQGRALDMQTNATLLTDEWADLIVRYNIQVGISLNGPGALNRSRWLENNEVTDRMTQRVHDAVERIGKLGQLSGLIVVLSRTNADTDEKLDALIEWAEKWVGETCGCWSIRWNPLFGGDEQLSPERLVEVYRRLVGATVADRHRLWLPFREFIDNLCGLGLRPCWMQPCDPYNTDAVHAIFYDGSEGNCLRTSPDGVPWQRAADKVFIRQDLLFQIPMEDGGCGGCRYWNFCHGGCPAEGEGDDWRNKTRWCDAIQGAYKAIEDGMSGWLPNWRPATNWQHPDDAALGRSIDARKPLINAFGAMVPSAKAPSTYERRSRPND